VLLRASGVEIAGGSRGDPPPARNSGLGSRAATPFDEGVHRPRFELLVALRLFMTIPKVARSGVR
jgi:hypothetical protein